MLFLFSNDAAALGIVALLLSLVCLGTWPAMIRWCTFGQQERHPCHVYIDYSFSYVLSSCVPILASLTLRSSSEQDYQSFLLTIIAMIGGMLLSFGNLAMQWAVVVFGAPLTTVLAIQASLTVVLGTSLNFFLEPSKTARPDLLFVGVVAFLVAICLATCAQIHYLQTKHGENYTECAEIQSNSDHSDAKPKQQGGLIALPMIDSGEVHLVNQHEGFVNNSESFYSDDDGQPPNRSDSFYSVGLCIAFSGGLCFGFFSPAFNVAVNDPFQWSASGGLSVAMANIWFSVAFCCTSIIGNTFLMTTNSNVVPRSSLRQYFTLESLLQRRIAFLGGFICALGNLLQFQGGKLAGFATADMVQAFPIVATVWDVTIFGEFRHASLCVLMLITSMYIAYLLGIAFLACSIDY